MRDWVIVGNSEVGNEGGILVLEGGQRSDPLCVDMRNLMISH